MASVSSGFLAASRHSRPRCFWRWRWIVLTVTFCNSSGCFFYATAVIDGCCFTFLLRILSVLWEVIHWALEPGFLYITVPSESTAAAFFEFCRLKLCSCLCPQLCISLTLPLQLRWWNGFFSLCKLGKTHCDDQKPCSRASNCCFLGIHCALLCWWTIKAGELYHTT